MKCAFAGVVAWVSCMLAGAPAFATAEETSATARRQESAALKVMAPVTVNYLESLPTNYASDDTRRWPLVIFLHGSGERGANLKKVAKHGPPKMVEEGRQFPFVLLSPQCPAGQSWDPVVLDLWLDEVVKKYRVDTTRIYLTGLSMGGYATWSWAQKTPERFAAIVPICGGGDPSRGARLKDVPTWAFHGAKDTVVSPAKTEEMIATITEAGGRPRYTLYPDAAHNSWTAAYADEDMWAWLLAQRRAKQ